MYSVTICLHDLAYGGSEEGGWYYSVCQPSDDHKEFLRCFDDQELACIYAHRLNDMVCPELNEGRPPIHHSNSIGQYWAVVFEGMPKSLPETRPHYN